MKGGTLGQLKKFFGFFKFSIFKFGQGDEQIRVWFFIHARVLEEGLGIEFAKEKCSRLLKPAR